MTTNLPAVPNLRLYQINMYFHGEPDADALKKVLDKGIRWIQYMPYCWFVLSSSDAERWYARLWPLLGDRDTMLICEVNSESVTCWIQQWVINWLAEAKEQIRESRPR